MKHFSLLPAFVTVTILALPLNAQNRIGFLGGMSLARISQTPASDDFTYTQYRGFAAGTFFERSLGDVAAIRFETSYIQKGGRIASSIYAYELQSWFDVGQSLKLAYIETATTLHLAPGKSSTRPYLMGGPFINYLVSARLIYTASGNGRSYADSEDISENINEMDFGFTFGGGIRFDLFFVEARYALGLSNIEKDSDVETLNRGFQFMTGISAPLDR